MSVSEAQAAARVGELLADKYRIKALIGAGGMGVVYAAVNEWIGREVALKLVHAELSSGQILARFFQEARVASQLDHPNIVTVFDLGRAEDGSWFIVQELLRGQSLEDKLCRRPLFLKEAVELLVPIMAALTVAHDAGILHRDLKPANIFLHQQGEETIPKLIDFGISKLLFAPDTQPFRTHGGWVGTPAYMAPEQIRAEENIGPAADVFSMAAVFYRCLGGRMLFEGNPVAVAAATTTRDPTPLAELAPFLSKPICDFVHQGLCRDASQRFADMRQMTSALLCLPELRQSAWGAQLLARVEAGSRSARQSFAELDLDGLAKLSVGRTWVGRDDTGEIVRPGSDTVRSVDLPRLAEFAPTQRDAHRSWLWRGAGLVIALLLASTLWLLWDAQSPNPASEPPEPPSTEALAQTLCLRWTPRLAKEQQANGAFTGLTPLPATGWATAQLSAALSSAALRCAEGAEDAQLRAVAALSSFELEHGWGEFDEGWETPAAAWVALWASERFSHDSSAMQDELGRALQVLAAAQRADGGFADPPDPASDGYQTALALLALLEGRSQLRERVNDVALRAGLEWLRSELRATLQASEQEPKTELGEGAGLVALASIPLSLAARVGLVDVRDGELLDACVQRMAADCSFDGEACRRSLFENDFVEVHVANAYRQGRLSMVWGPWTWLAVKVLLDDARLSDASRQTLLAIQRGFRVALPRLAEDDSALLGFTLAEWLFVAARLSHGSALLGLEP